MVCALGGFYRFASPESVLSNQELLVIAKSAQVEAQRRYCPMNFDEAHKDDIADLIIGDAVSRGFDREKLNSDGTLEVIESAASQILSGLEGRCNQIARLSDVAPLKFDPMKRKKSAHEVKLEKRKQAERFQNALEVAATMADAPSVAVSK